MTGGEAHLGGVENIEDCCCHWVLISILLADDLNVTQLPKEKVSLRLPRLQVGPQLVPLHSRCNSENDGNQRYILASLVRDDDTSTWFGGSLEGEFTSLIRSSILSAEPGFSAPTILGDVLVAGSLREAAGIKIGSE